jgi:hypothetical protein
MVNANYTLFYLYPSKCERYFGIIPTTNWLAIEAYPRSPSQRMPNYLFLFHPYRSDPIHGNALDSCRVTLKSN